MQIRHEEQTDMLGFEKLDASKLEQLELEEPHRWPEALRQMYDILKAELDAAEQDPSVALRQLNQICRAFGGMQMYLPRGKNLETAILHFQVWEDFKGDNVPELSRKYNMSMQHVYRVIAKMRDRETKLRQQDLFS